MTTVRASAEEITIEMAESEEVTLLANIRDENSQLSTELIAALTGATAIWYLRDGPNDTTNLDVQRAATIDAAAGTIEALILSADTAGQAPGTTVVSRYHELWVTPVGSGGIPVVYGPLPIRPSTQS